MTALLQTKYLTVNSDAGRPLFENLDLTMGRDRVAIVGRNGVGKSTLLSVLAGRRAPDTGEVRRHGRVVLVPQTLTDAPTPPLNDAARTEADALDLPSHGGSPGQRRKLHLLSAKHSNADLLLLDEPTDDLDEPGVAWLKAWITAWSGGLLVVSHDPRLLECLEHFFVAAETGCRYVPGTFSAVTAALELERDQTQRRYLQHLNRLADSEWHDTRVTRRRRRKKNLGRLHEEGRAPSRAQLHSKKSYAQESQGRAAKIRQARMKGIRSWAKATRRALAVDLPLDAVMPRFDKAAKQVRIALRAVGAEVDGRWLFDGVDLTIGIEDRVAVTGPNGSGKTTLLRIARGARAPDRGQATVFGAIGSIAQGGEDWRLDDSLLDQLSRQLESTDDVAAAVIAHRFPLALAERPLATLSPGERVRAALLCLMQRRPAPAVLVLDEPSDSLDFVGAKALARVLSAWPGGLLVSSHDRTLVESIRPTTQVELGQD